MKFISNIGLLLKGFFVGGTMLVPGCSGGTMCIILGVYDKLISSVSSFFKDKIKNVTFLIMFAIGALAGIVLCSKPILALIEAYPIRMMYLFIGAVCGGIPLIIKEAKIKKFTPVLPIYPIIGFAIVFSINFLPENLIQADSGLDLGIVILLLFAGFISAIALILPGISLSYFLVILGLYEKIVSAIGRFDILFLLPFGIGLLIGIVSTVKLLEAAMKKYTTATYLIILGFIIGSIVKVFPGVYADFEFLIGIMFFATGFFAIYKLAELENKKQ